MHQLRGLCGQPIRRNSGSEDRAELLREAVGTARVTVVARYCHPPLKGDDIALVVPGTDVPEQEDHAYRRRLSLSGRRLRADRAESRGHAAAGFTSPRA